MIVTATVSGNSLRARLFRFAATPALFWLIGAAWLFNTDVSIKWEHIARARQ